MVLNEKNIFINIIFDKKKIPLKSRKEQFNFVLFFTSILHQRQFCSRHYRILNVDTYFNENLNMGLTTYERLSACLVTRYRSTFIVEVVKTMFAMKIGWFGLLQHWKTTFKPLRPCDASSTV